MVQVPRPAPTWPCYLRPDFVSAVKQTDGSYLWSYLVNAAKRTQPDGTQCGGMFWDPSFPTGQGRPYDGFDVWPIHGYVPGSGTAIYPTPTAVVIVDQNGGFAFEYDLGGRIDSQQGAEVKFAEFTFRSWVGDGAWQQVFHGYGLNSATGDELLGMWRWIYLPKPAKQVQLRGGSAADHAAFTGAPRELTVVTDDYSLRMHDGVTPGGRPVGGGATAPTPSDSVINETSFDLLPNAGVSPQYARADHTHGTPPAPAGGTGVPATSVVTERAFGQAEAVGTSTQYARADHTHGTPPAPVIPLGGNTVVGEQAFGQSPMPGTSALFSRADHTHGTPPTPVIPGPASTVVTERAFGLGESVGSSTLYARADHTHGTPPAPAVPNPATSVQPERTFGLGESVGTSTQYARADHTHGTPPAPGGGGNVVGTATAYQVASTGTGVIASSKTGSVTELGYTDITGQPGGLYVKVSVPTPERMEELGVVVGLSCDNASKSHAAMEHARSFLNGVATIDFVVREWFNTGLEPLMNVSVIVFG